MRATLAANAARLLRSIADADQDKLTECAIVAVAKPAER
jgi:hypothetical protein